LGLDSLLVYASIHTYETLSPNILGSLNVIYNDGTKLSFDVEREAYLHVDLFDVLGRKIDENGSGVYEKGHYEIPLKYNSWAAGSYYVRITTANNELRTLKVIKE